MALKLRIRNLRALRDVTWEPSPVSIIVGANGAGKSTLFHVLLFLRLAFERGVEEGSLALGGSQHLRHWAAREDEPIEIGVSLGETAWELTLVPQGATIEIRTETLHADDREVFARDASGILRFQDKKFSVDERFALKVLVDAQEDHPALHQMETFLKGLSVFYDPELYAIARGARIDESRILQHRGRNAIAVLRRWLLERQHRHRYNFVLDGLRAAFPGQIDDFEFLEAGTTVVGRIFRPGSESPLPLTQEANGVVAMLVLLCDLASTDPGTLVAIDEPEYALHPFAIRCFLRRAEAWSTQQGVTVAMATHSPVILDEVQDAVDRIFVLRPGDGENLQPLTRLKNREWLVQYAMGDLYAEGEIGANDDTRLSGAH